MVHVHRLTSNTRRATCALTCMAASKFLRPMLIKKGKANGDIMKSELPKHDPTSIC